MATEQKIAGAYIQILSKGMEKVQAELDKMKGALDKAAGKSKEADKAQDELAKATKLTTERFALLGQTINQIGGIAQRAFGIAAASLTGFLAIADPVGMQRLQGSVMALSVQIGAIFIPVIDLLRDKLEEATLWMRGLSEEQRANIRWWAALTLGVLGIVAIVPRVINGIMGISTALRVLRATAALASFGILPIIGVIVGLVTALFAARQATDRAQAGMGGFAGIIETLRGVFDSLLSGVQTVMQVLGPLVTTVMDAIQRAFVALAPVVTAVLGVLMIVVRQLARSFMTALAIGIAFVNGIISMVGRLLTTAAPLLETFAGYYERMGDWITRVLRSLEPVYAWFTELFASSFGSIESQVTGFMSMMEPIFATMQDIAYATGDVFEWLTDIIVGAIDWIVEAIGEIIPSFREAFGNSESYLNTFYGVCRVVFEGIGAIIRTLISTVVYLASLMRSVTSGNWNGALQRARDAVTSYEEQIERRRQADADDAAFNAFVQQSEREEAERARQEDRDARDLMRDTPDRDRPDRSRGPLESTKIEFVGLADAWKKAQAAAAQIETPEARAERERHEVRVRQGDRTNVLLTEIAGNTESDGDMFTD